MEKLEERFRSLEADILDPKSVLHVDGLLVSIHGSCGWVAKWGGPCVLLDDVLVNERTCLGTRDEQACSSSSREGGSWQTRD